VHPIHTEVVANIKSGDEVLSLLGSVIALRCVQLYLQQHKMSYLILGVLGYLMGSFSKESTVLMMFMVPLFIYYFTETDLKKNILISSIFAVCSAFFLFCRHLALSGYPPTSPLSALDNYLVLSNDNIPIRMASAINTLRLVFKNIFYSSSTLLRLFLLLIVRTGKKLSRTHLLIVLSYLLPAYSCMPFGI
jgi:hypothetical protein